MPDELGYQQIPLATWSSLAGDMDEVNKDLQWPKFIGLYNRMRREDAQVGSVLRAVTLPIRSAAWSIDPAGARDEVVNLVATDLGLNVKGRPPLAQLRTRDKFSWGDHLRLALLMLPFGHSYFEQVYRVEEGRARLRKLAWRPPSTISEINVAPDGGLVSIKQLGLSGTDIVIPVARLVAYVNEREGGNWLGSSLLRPAYKMWLLKDRMLRSQSLTVERNGLGVPVYTGAPLPDAVAADEDKRDGWLQSEKESGLKAAKGFRAGEAAGASLPPGAKLELLSVLGKLPDTDGPIRYFDEQIARGVLAHFLNLGTETGSWALGSTFANFFTNSLNAVAASFADTTQQHVVEDLVDLNFGPNEPAPRLVFEPIGSEFPATADAIKTLVDAGVIQPDEQLDAFMRTSFRLPVAGTPRKSPAEHAVDSSDSDKALAAANAVQKVYLGVGKVLTEDEARDSVRRAGADLTGNLPPQPPSSDPTAAEAA